MEQELLNRLEKIEAQLSKKKKDAWEKIQVLTPLLIPLTIAVVGWYFTREHNRNQLEIQRINNENQLQVALINANVGQSELIKDFMQHLTSKDTSSRNIAIEAILYAAPTPGKKIVEIIAKSGDSKAREIANDALSSKKQDLIDNLFSTQKQARLIAANEITSNWTTDESLCRALILRADNCLTNKDASPDCDNGVFNTIAVLASFSKQILTTHKTEIINLVKKVPTSSQRTIAQSEALMKAIN